jgi:hypothetical protein
MLFLAIPLQLFASDADKSLVGIWNFDNDNEKVIKNSVNEKFNAISNQPVSLVEGVFGKGIDLKGSKIEIPADFIPSGMEQLTFSAWVAPRQLDGVCTILRKEDASGPVQNQLLFGFQNSGNFLTLGINTGGNYGECDAVIDKSEVLDGNWHFVAGTFDGQFMRVYLDGKEIGSYERQSPKINTSADFRPLKHYWRYEYGGWTNVDDVTVNVPAYIGSSKGSLEFFDGKLDDLRFYKRALSRQEIAEIFENGKQTTANSALKNAETKAAELYVKSDSYLKTLTATRAKIAQAGNLDSLTIVALHRNLRNDYPSEVSNAIVKYDRSSVVMMTWDTDKLMQRAAELETAYIEYLPLTETQWKLLSDKNREKWNHVKSIYEAYINEKNKTSDKNASVLFEAVYEMEKEVEKRPSVGETVAGYVEPSTPEVKNRTPEEAKKIIEAEWLFQCDNKPTAEQTLREIEWTRKLAARIEKQYPDKIKFDAERGKLEDLEEAAKAKAAADLDTDLYFSVRNIKRGIMFRNPVLDFDSLIFVDGPTPRGREPHHETRHRLGYMAIPGARLMKLQGLNPDGYQTKLLPKEPLHGSFWRPDLSYDAKRILVSFKPHNDKNFHIYEVNIDGTGERQLTGGIFDDLDPIYLPDGKNMMFLTTRGHIYVRCMPPTNAFVMARMALDTKLGNKNLYIISRNGEPEYTPSVMQDGRVIYTRWEYTDKPLWRAQSLWTMNSDGTLVQTFWGNQSVWPDLLKDARQIPGSERVMFTGSAHHDWFNGSVGIIDPSKGFNFPDGLTKVTQEIVWPETGNGPVDPKETDDYHTAGRYRNYYSPYPLSEQDFLVSAQRDLRGDRFVLMLMDVNGNREIVFEGVHHIWDAQPVRTRPVPPVSADRVNWPKWEERDKPGTGIIYSNNVYDNAPDKLRGKAKYLRIWSIDHKTYTYWGKRNYVSSGPEISASQSEGIKKIIGTVPIEADGSVSFEAPTGIALHFQLLDENQLALQTMKSFTGVLPGEVRGCLGCHESHIRTPVTNQTGRALKKAPLKIKPVDWQDISVSFERYVQPTLDKYCGKCHQDPENDAYKKFNATLRPGFLGFKEPYMTLMGNPIWARQYNLPKGNGGLGWADTIIVEGYTTVDPKAYATFPPMERLSYVSRLVHRMRSGEHNGVKVMGDDLLRVILWVDAMGPYYGTEEVRYMEDPIFQGVGWISQKPRIRTAPIVQRPGPFDPFQTDTDPAYDNPAPENFNNLPCGVNR